MIEPLERGFVDTRVISALNGRDVKDSDEKESIMKVV